MIWRWIANWCCPRRAFWWAEVDERLRVPIQIDGRALAKASVRHRPR